MPAARSVLVDGQTVHFDYVPALALWRLRGSDRPEIRLQRGLGGDGAGVGWSVRAPKHLLWFVGSWKVAAKVAARARLEHFCKACGHDKKWHTAANCCLGLGLVEETSKPFCACMKWEAWR